MIVEGIYENGIVRLKNMIKIPDKSEVFVIYKSRDSKENFKQSAGSLKDIDMNIDINSGLTESKISNEQTLATINIGPVNITSFEIWYTGNTYIVKGNISVNGTLIVQPGVTIIIDGNYTIYVNGTLFIYGLQSNKVTITASGTDPEPGQWDCIFIDNKGNGT